MLVKCPECSKEISEQAYTCPHCGVPISESPGEKQIIAFRKRILIGGMILCILGIPIGIALKLPYVWGLGIAGIIVGSIKLATLSK